MARHKDTRDSTRRQYMKLKTAIWSIKNQFAVEY